MASQRREAGVERRRGAKNPTHAHILGKELGEPADQRIELGVVGPRRARIGMGQGLGGYIDVGHLAGGMHAGVGASGREQPNRNPEDRRERFVEHTGDGAMTLLGGPAAEIGSVVGDVEA